MHAWTAPPGTDYLSARGRVATAAATRRQSITTPVGGASHAREASQRSGIKELKSDFAGGRLPCSDFDANALYVCMCALAYNVFALLHAGLPPEFRFARAQRCACDCLHWRQRLCNMGDNGHSNYTKGITNY